MHAQLGPIFGQAARTDLPPGKASWADEITVETVLHKIPPAAFSALELRRPHRQSAGVMKTTGLHVGDVGPLLSELWPYRDCLFQLKQSSFQPRDHVRQGGKVRRGGYTEVTGDSGVHRFPGVLDNQTGPPATQRLNLMRVNPETGQQERATSSQGMPPV